MQYRNMTTVLTREYLDSRPDGWMDYAAKRIAQLYAILLLDYQRKISSSSINFCVIYLVEWFTPHELHKFFSHFGFFHIIEVLRIAATGRFVRSTLIQFCLPNHHFTLASLKNVLLLETQVIF